MKARYIDLPSDRLPHAVYSPAYWDAAERGASLEIDPRPTPPSGDEWQYCNEPHFHVLSPVGMPLPPGCIGWVTCACLIELDESALDAEMESVLASEPALEGMAR